MRTLHGDRLSSYVVQSQAGVSFGMRDGGYFEFEPPPHSWLLALRKPASRYNGWEHLFNQSVMDSFINVVAHKAVYTITFEIHYKGQSGSVGDLLTDQRRQFQTLITVES